MPNVFFDKEKAWDSYCESGGLRADAQEIATAKMLTDPGYFTDCLNEVCNSIDETQIRQFLNDPSDFGPWLKDKVLDHAIFDNEALAAEIWEENHAER